jgi:hypothetical protein
MQKYKKTTILMPERQNFHNRWSAAQARHSNLCLKGRTNNGIQNPAFQAEASRTLFIRKLRYRLYAVMKIAPFRR